ncbi:MAG: branched-chain amino acid ABC transporter substrate-binding protein [Thermomicrobiales bacterium]
MARESIAGLIAQLYGARISRREFARRAGVAGLSAGLVGNVLAAHAAKAQDLPPAATIGTPGSEHSTDTSKGTIKLYSSWPFTGTMEILGTHAIEASRMCLEDFGVAAGGYAIDYEPLDGGVAANEGKWEPGKETENVNTAVNDPECMVYLGTYNSGAAAISIPITNVAGMAQISFANTYPGLTTSFEGATEEGEPDLFYPSGTRNYMRVCPADHIQGGASARWARAQGKEKAYILHDKSLYGQGVANVFALVFEEEGGEVLGNEGFDASFEDYQSVMQGIADLGPDILYVGSTSDNNASKVLQDMRGVMSAEDVVFLGPDGLNNQAFLDGAADAAEGAYITFAGYTADKLLEGGGPGADYVTRISERLGLSEGDAPDAYALYAYESMVVTLQAIDRAGVNDRAEILNQMWNTEGFVSLMGTTWSFNDEGDTDSTIIGLAQVIDGRITWVEAIS